MTRYLLAGLLVALFVAAWQGVATLDSVDDLTLASPVETWRALRDDWGLLRDNAGALVLLGLAIAWRPGLLAIGMHLVRPLRDAAYRVASQAIPIVVLAPIFVLAFDYGLGPKLAIVALICFFPITVNLSTACAPRRRAAEADAQHGRLATAHAAVGRAARIAALSVQRAEGGRYGVGNRRRVRGMGGGRRGARTARPARQ